LNPDLPIKFSLLIRLKTVIVRYGRFFIGLVICISCAEEDVKDKPVYNGPTISMDSVNTMLTDSAELILRMQAPKEEAFENGDREWKEGLSLQYFDEEGRVSSTFKSEYAYYQKEENLYKGTGDVVVKSLKNGDELNTEELFWDPDKKEFYTDKFVTIRTDDELHKGEGLRANEDFTWYKIIKPSGTFTLEDEGNNDENI
jgi:LPS export ABC transporter protein LptC